MARYRYEDVKAALDKMENILMSMDSRTWEHYAHLLEDDIAVLMEKVETLEAKIVNMQRDINGH